MLSLIDDAGDIVKGLIGLGSEFIEDKDKRNEFNYKAMELNNQMNLAIMNKETHPWVDAAVKLLYAFNSLWRPLGSAAMTGFAIYAWAKGIEIDATGHTILASAFPGWMTSRHFNKQNGKS